MVEARTLQAPEKRQFGVRAPRRRAPLGKAPGKNLVKEAEGLMSCALRLRNTDPQRAARAAERAFGSYFAASKTEFSEKKRADCLIGAGKALSLAAELCEEKDPRRSGRMHEQAGDQFYAGARHGTMPESEAKRMAKEQYVLALRLGGNAYVLMRKIGTCGRVSPA